MRDLFSAIAQHPVSGVKNGELPRTGSRTLLHG